MSEVGALFTLLFIKNLRKYELWKSVLVFACLCAFNYNLVLAYPCGSKYIPLSWNVN